MHLFPLQHYNTGIKLRINAQRWVLFFKVLRVNKGAARVRDAVTLNEDVGQWDATHKPHVFSSLFALAT